MLRMQNSKHIESALTFDALLNNQLDKKFYNLNYNWWENNYVPWTQISQMREDAHEKNYWQKLCEFLALVEGCALYPYQDSSHYSIGFGLLLKRSDKKEYEPLAYRIFQEALGIDLYNFLPIELFDLEVEELVSSLKAYRITKDQAYTLLSHTLAYNEVMIQNKIPKFEKLQPNQKIALHSLFYNSPSLLGINLVSALNEYLNSKQLVCLLDVIDEIEQNSNRFLPGSNYYFGLQNRRFCESVMFSNRQLDFITRIPNSLFYKFFAQLSIDMPHLHAVLSKFLYLCDDLFESLKLAILSDHIKHAVFPDIDYLKRKLYELSKE